MSHVLDRPIWHALSTRHAALAAGNSLAKRYLPSVHPFACGRDESPESLAALAGIAAPGETLILLQADEFVLPPYIRKSDAITTSRRCGCSSTTPGRHRSRPGQSATGCFATRSPRSRAGRSDRSAARRCAR
jgi:hypothetical protein